MVRLPPPAISALDAWIAAQPEPRPTRPEAIRRCLAEALAKTPDAESHDKLANLVAGLFVASRLYERTTPQDLDVELALSKAFSGAYALARGAGVTDDAMRKASAKLGKRRKLSADERRW